MTKDPFMKVTKRIERRFNRYSGNENKIYCEGVLDVLESSPAIRLCKYSGKDATIYKIGTHDGAEFFRYFPFKHLSWHKALTKFLRD